jgi:hypothetical protein
MNRKHFLKFSECPFKSCGALTLRSLEVKSEASYARTEEKMGLWLATGKGMLPGPEETWLCGLPRAQESFFCSGLPPQYMMFSLVNSPTGNT